MNGIRKIALLTLIIALFCVSAAAEVVAAGNVNLRSGPGLGFDVVENAGSGMIMPYLGSTSVDERGIAWYLVDCNGTQCWVSSKFAELNEKIKVVPVLDPVELEGYLELSPWLLADLETAAAEIGLKNYAEAMSEAPYQYFDDTLTIGGYDSMEYAELIGGEYTLFGAAVGMEIETAMENIASYGLDLFMQEYDCVVFERPAIQESYISVDGYDSCVNLYLVDGVVSEISWSTYSG